MPHRIISLGAGFSVSKFANYDTIFKEKILSTILNSSYANSSTYKAVQKRVADLESLIMRAEQESISSEEFKTRITEGWQMYLADWEFDSDEETFEIREKTELKKFRDSRGQ